jgi:hypothetical protein
MLPAFMEIAGGEEPASIDGISFMPTLLGISPVGGSESRRG